MWKLLLMEFIHSILSSLFSFMSINFASFWEEKSQSLSWLNRNEILRSQKRALLLHYLPSSCLIQPQCKHFHPQKVTAKGGSPPGKPRAWFPSWIYWEMVKLHSYEKAEAVSEWRVVVKSLRSSVGKAPQSPAQLPPLLWRRFPRPQPEGLYCTVRTEACTSPSITVVTIFEVSDLSSLDYPVWL